MYLEFKLDYLPSDCWIIRCEVKNLYLQLEIFEAFWIIPTGENKRLKNSFVINKNSWRIPVDIPFRNPLLIAAGITYF